MSTHPPAIRWLVALWGETVVPVSVSGLTAGRTTYLQRPVAGEESGQRADGALVGHVEVASAADLLPTIAEGSIELFTEQRRASVVEQETAPTSESLFSSSWRHLSRLPNLLQLPALSSSNKPAAQPPFTPSMEQDARPSSPSNASSRSVPSASSSPGPSSRSLSDKAKGRRDTRVCRSARPSPRARA